MLKLTRLNNHTVAINPDHIGWADAAPDTTLFLISGDKIIVRESLDELISRVIEFRRLIRAGWPTAGDYSDTGDVPRVGIPSHRPVTDPPQRPSLAPLGRREGR